MKDALTSAVGYLRTSSSANVGEEKDSDTRQKLAIQAACARMGFVIVEWFYDAGISGDAEWTVRPAFQAMLDRIDGNGIRTVFIESADRFARRMLIAETGVLLLANRDVRLFTSTGENLTDTDDEMRVAFRQIAMAFAQLEKARLVKKLRAARDRKSEVQGRRIEGRKLDPVQVAAAKALNDGRSLRAIASLLAEQGIVTAAGTTLSAAHIARLLKG